LGADDVLSGASVGVAVALEIPSLNSRMPRPRDRPA